MPAKVSRFREVVDHRSCRFRPDDGIELLARGATHGGHAAECGQQRAATARPDAWDAIELRPQIAHRSRLAVKRHGEAVRLVADALQQQERRIVLRQHDRVAARSRVKSSSSRFAIPTATRFASPIDSSAVVRGRQLPLAAVDQDQIRKRSAVLRARVR